MKQPDNVVLVHFAHDMDSSWYEARFPDVTLNGSYDNHTSIEYFALKHGWAVMWVGDDHYNPWRTN